MGDGSRACSPQGRPVVAKVNPGSETGRGRSRGARRVARAPSPCKCSARHRNGDGGHQWVRQWVPVVEVVLAERVEAAGEGALDQWAAMMSGVRLGGTW